MNKNRLPRLRYEEPKTAEEASRIKRDFGEEAIILAGGTDVIPLLKRRNIPARIVINIKRIPELHRITYDQVKGLKVGATVTLREVAEHPVTAGAYPSLVEAALSVAYNQIRNMGTLVGNICVDNKCSYFNQTAFWWQSRTDCFKRGGDRCYVVKGGKQCHALSVGDTVSALMVLDASVSIFGPERERHVPLKDFYTGDGRRPHRLASDEFVTGVMIPVPAHGWREGFVKKSHRGSVDFAIASLSLRLKGNGEGVEDVRIAMNGVSSEPIRPAGVERYLIGKRLDREVIAEALRLILKEARPISPIGASTLLRRKMIEAMFVDLIEKTGVQYEKTNLRA